MTEIEAENVFSWLCRRWVNHANINIELNTRDFRFVFFEHEKCYVPTVLVNIFSLHSRLAFVSKETGEPISTKHMDIKEFIENLFKAAKSSSIYIGGSTRPPFINKNESYEEILVKVDLESI